ncbi:hypothetical protein LCM4579_18520 [Ensifer sp. LCM 4579]|nr:hypothetical protein LCM4579_18520 [Ensifer sp. LCM 4579]
MAQDFDRSCEDAAFQSATVWSGAGLSQNSTSAPEQLVLDPDPGLMQFDAGGGDDVLYLVDPPGGQSIIAGPGADTVVICRMTDTLIHIKLGDETTGGADLEPDRVILNPPVFQGIPDGFIRQVFVYGVSPQNDRIELRLPPGVDFHYETGRIRAGRVIFNVAPGNPADRIDRSVFEVRRDGGGGPASALPKVGSALSAYHPGRTCSDAAAETFATGREDGFAYLSYSQQKDVVTTARIPGGRVHHTWDGPDLVYIESSQTLFTGRGADQVVVCALDDPVTMISVGPGGLTEDFDPDVVIVEAARFQDGVKRKLEVHGVSSVNDRVVLRLPPGLEPGIELTTSGSVRAYVGDLTIAVLADWRQEGGSGHRDVFVVERVAPVDVAKATRTGLPDLSAVACPDPDAPGAFAEGRPDPFNPTAVVYSPEAERVLVGGAAGIYLVNAAEGDDTIFVVDPLDGVLVRGDRGSDIVAVCSMRSLSLVIELGDAQQSADATPDAVILEPAVFLGVPDGARRRIDVFGAVVADDRLLLRLPPGVTAKKPRDTGYGVVEIDVGDVLVSIYRVDDFMSVKLPPDAVQVVRAATAAAPAAAAGMPPPNLSARNLACPEPDAGGFAEPTDPGRTSLDTALYGTGSDRVLIAAHPGWVHYYTSDGDDTVFVTDSIADLQVHLGRGGDTAVVCSTKEMSLGFDLGPHDANPDTLVLRPEVFLGIPEGYTRRVFVSGVVEANDRIALDLPPGMAAKIRQQSTANMLEATVGRNTITAMTTGDAFGRRGNPGIFVIAGGAPGAAPEARSDPDREGNPDQIPSGKWSFDPAEGMEGQAGVTGERGSRLQVSCGNSGGPSLSIVPDPRGGGPSGEEQQVGFHLDIDGRAFEQSFICAPDGNHCSAYGIPSPSVISAIRSGSRLTIREGRTDLAAYTLKGSNAAISRLSACLE